MKNILVLRGLWATLQSIFHMKVPFFAWPLAYLLIALPVYGQNESPESSPEDKAFNAITALMAKTKQGGQNPSEEDYKARREAGIEMAKNARNFLHDYPESKHAEDAQGLLNIGLFEGALAGDSAAAEELKHSVERALKDPKVPEQLKLHTFVVNQIAQWAK